VSVDSTERAYDSENYFFDKYFNKSTLSLETLPDELADRIVDTVNEVKRDIPSIIKHRDFYFNRTTPEFIKYEKASINAYRHEAGRNREDSLDVSDSQKPSMK